MKKLLILFFLFCFCLSVYGIENICPINDITELEKYKACNIAVAHQDCLSSGDCSTTTIDVIDPKGNVKVDDGTMAWDDDLIGYYYSASAFDTAGTWAIIVSFNTADNNILWGTIKVSEKEIYVNPVTKQEEEFNLSFLGYQLNTYTIWGIGLLVLIIILILAYSIQGGR
jgi:hypothetical protein